MWKKLHLLRNDVNSFNISSSEILNADFTLSFVGFSLQMIARGKNASDLFPAVVKNVACKNIEVRNIPGFMWLHVLFATFHLFSMVKISFSAKKKIPLLVNYASIYQGFF